jgi:hypothetical protein
MLTFILITVGFIIIFAILLLFGIVKKSRKTVYFSLLFLLFAIFSGIYTGVLFARKAYDKLKTVKIENPLRKRTGMEMYTALLGEPTTNCVTVTNSQDQYIPKIDCCIWLEFTTCPNELARIIAEKKLKPIEPETRYYGDSSNAVITDSNIPDYSPRPKWFTPQNLGKDYKTLRKYNIDDPNHDVILYFSKDSTHAFYCDMAE